ncbi:MAG TPA: hypothetical protein VLF90_04785 [Patescibacteria group bacterium]|nr:hypothetical protein [Patescibacteria group bacterium]
MLSVEELTSRYEDVSKRIENSRAQLEKRKHGLTVSWSGRAGLESSIELEAVSREKGIAILERGRGNLRAAIDAAITTELAQFDDILAPSGWVEKPMAMHDDQPVHASVGQ